MLNAFGSDSYSEWVGRKFTIIIIADIANIGHGYGHSESQPIWNIICKIADGRLNWYQAFNQDEPTSLQQFLQQFVKLHSHQLHS